MKQVRAVYKGHVQGVGFRFTVMHLSHGVNISGYVKNAPDGSVELVAEGAESDLKEFLKKIQGSLLGGHIRDCIESWSDASGIYSSFGIQY